MARKSEPLHVVTDFATRGGAERMLARYAGSAEDRGTIVALMKSEPALFDHLVRHELRATALGASSVAGLLRSVGVLARTIREQRPSAIMCWMYHAHVIGTLAALAARYRGPVIWNIRQGLDDPSALSRSTRVALRAGAMIRSRADAMIFNSVRALEQHVARGYSHGGVVIANGLDLPQAAARSRSPAPIIGMAAHFHPKKDYGNYFAACARVSAAFPEARFVAAGRGVDGANPELAAALAASGVPADRVSLLGDLDEMSGFYRSLDILVLSSRTEGFPNVLVEAMSFGVPCVSTDVGDAAIAVGDTGRIVPPRDSAALAQAVQGLLSLPADAYAQLSAAARRRVEDHYSIDGVAAQYDAFIEECIVRAADRRGAGARGHN